ncbi:GNAT family N-acetyltransferase [Streptomyces sp. NRRL S-241]|uniref:GNAT family N-acetyltransferase n=1 Tax=Streptomyces sp. NRRL S-241 TaxID=1463896 RepID=UPI000995EB5B|nr:GNAT family N-acetyltransferase [Streptomyces sp. NRRL S-241]
MQSTYSGHGGAASASLLFDPTNDGPAILTEIAVWEEHRGKGWASELLRQICQEADREGLTLLLSVEPGPRGLSYEALAEWYQRCGFEVGHPTETADPAILIRLPQAAV